MTTAADERCTDYQLGEALTSYCFGELPAPQAEAVESHLLGCEACSHEFRRLEVSVRILRTERQAQSVLRPEQIVSQLGLSSHLVRPFCGHRGFVVTVALLYGIEWAVGLWSELGYSYDRFGSLAWALSLPVAGAVAASVLASLWVDCLAVRAGQANGLTRSLAVIVGVLGTVTIALVLLLPDEQTIAASFQTRTASGGYFKDVMFIFAPLLLFVVPSFHTIVVLQRELKAGRHEQVLALLRRSPDSIVPRGVWYLSPRFLAGFLLVAGTLKIVGANHMLDALVSGPYANLFSMASYISTVLWFAIAIVCLAWYATSLNELKRECVAIKSLLPQESATER